MDDSNGADSQAADGGEARARRFRSGLVAAGAAAGLTLAGLGVAAGQTDSTTSTPADPSTTAAPAPSTSAPSAAAPSTAAPAPVPGAPGTAAGPGFGPGPGPGMGMGGFRGGPGGPHMAMGGPGIHGEFTIPKRGGGYETLANQMGEVTAVSSSSVTVKSEDGFSRTYGVDDNTMVNAGNNGIADVANGDQVHVTALVVDGKAGAVEIQDVTKDKQLHERWAPGPPPRPAGPNAQPDAGSTTPTTTN